MSTTRYPNASRLLAREFAPGAGSSFQSSSSPTSEQYLRDFLKQTKFNPSNPSAHRWELTPNQKVTPGLQRAAQKQANREIEALGRKLAKEGIAVAERRLIMRLALRGILRFIPYINLIILAWDAYELYQYLSQPAAGVKNQWFPGCKTPFQGPYNGGAVGWPCANTYSKAVPSTSGMSTTNYNFQDGDGLVPAWVGSWIGETFPNGLPSVPGPPTAQGSYAGTRYMGRNVGETSPQERTSSPQLPDLPTVYPDPLVPPARAPKPTPATASSPNPTPTTNPTPQPNPSPMPESVSPAAPWPALPPGTVSGLLPYAPPVQEPGMAPLPDPKPRPITVQRPDIVPWWPQLPGGAPTQGHGSQPKPDVKPPATSPAISTTPSGKGSPPRGRTRDKHKYRRPGPKEKEKKIKYGSKGFKLAGFLMNFATESSDLIDSFYAALPKKVRGRDWYKNGKRTPSTVNKLATLWKHWHEVDGVKAIQNIAANQLEDFVFGKAGSTATKGLLKSGTNNLLPGSKLGGNAPSVDWRSLGL